MSFLEMTDSEDKKQKLPANEEIKKMKLEYKLADDTAKRPSVRRDTTSTTEEKNAALYKNKLQKGECPQPTTVTGWGACLYTILFDKTEKPKPP